MIGGYGKYKESDIPDFSGRKDILEFAIPHFRFLSESPENSNIGGYWKIYECSIIARCHHTAPNISKIEFISRKKVVKKAKVTTKKICKNIICLAVIGGNGRSSSPCKLTSNIEELVTIIPLGNNYPKDLD